MIRMTTTAFLGAAVAIGLVGAGNAADRGLYGVHDRTVIIEHVAPRHGGPNEDSFIVERDDRGVLACYDAIYYPAKYRVDPQGIYVQGAKRRFVDTGAQYQLRRSAPVYIETRSRVKSDYVSLRRAHCVR